MAEFTVLDRKGEPLHYLGKIITFPTKARAHAFCGHACTIVAADEEAAAAAIGGEQVPEVFGSCYVDGLFATTKHT